MPNSETEVTHRMRKLQIKTIISCHQVISNSKKN
jgi:hypothetical protein